jgi:predicted enzyme related to lactoylglutathione lyase
MIGAAPARPAAGHRLEETVMANNRVVHFEIPADDPQALTEFYGTLFGWSFQRASGAVEYWNCVTGTEEPGINGGIVKRQNLQHPPMNYIDVASIDATLDQATKLGAKIALPKMQIPGVAAIACLIDPEGNIFALRELLQTQGTEEG